MKVEIYLNGLDINEHQATKIAEELNKYFENKFGINPKIIVQPSCWLYEKKLKNEK